MICKKCHKEIPEVSVYCMWCGRKQVQAERIKRRANGTGSVYKMSGSRSRPWRAVATDHGKRITVGSYATQTEALKALAAFEPRGSVVRSDMTLEDVYEVWGNVKRDTMSKSGWGNYEAAWKHMEHLAPVRLSELKTADYQKVIDGIKDKLSRSSCEKVRNLASQLCQWGMQNDIIDRNYAEYLVLPAQTENDEREYFTEDEIERLWGVSDRFAAQVILVMIYTGMRINELFALTPADVHLDEEIAPGRYATYAIGGEKTDAGRNRTIMIHPRAVPIVREWMDRAGSLYLVERGNRHTMVDDHNFRRRDYYPLIDELQIARIPPHKARHTFASRGAKANIAPTVLKDLIGHEKYETTVDYYTHVDLVQLADGIEMIEK